MMWYTYNNESIASIERGIIGVFNKKLLLWELLLWELLLWKQYILEWRWKVLFLSGDESVCFNTLTSNNHFLYTSNSPLTFGYCDT